MANLKEIRTRISSITSTRQITSAMKMVSAAKLRRAQDAIIQLRPYAKKLDELLSNLIVSAESVHTSNLIKKVENDINNILIIIITSNKGLCGSFNSNIVKTALNHAENKYPTHFKENKVFFYIIGKKGYDQLKNRKINIYGTNNDILNHLNYYNSLSISEKLIEDYLSQKFDIIEVVYNQFKNAAVQTVTIEQLLPIDFSNTEKKESTINITENFILEPSKEYIIQKLLPKFIRIKFYKNLLDSVTSEHGARMTAMHQATDNANELLRELVLSYNKARQAAITKEIIEIVGGAEALKG
jgi:F-type H+-transporting ATPase subunit gamma